MHEICDAWALGCKDLPISVLSVSRFERIALAARVLSFSLKPRYDTRASRRPRESRSHGSLGTSCGTMAGSRPGTAGGTPEEPSQEQLGYACYGERNKTYPNGEQTRWVKIQQWHTTAVGERVWLLYKPGLSLVNGWHEHPHELDDSALVNCEITERCPEWRFAVDDTYAGCKSQDKSGHARTERARLRLSSTTRRSIPWMGQSDVPLHCPLAYIPVHFPLPRIEHHGHDILPLPPLEGLNICVVETHELRYIERLSEAERDWWVTTKTTLPRIVLFCEETIDIGPCQICKMCFKHNALRKFLS
jgi:hypothetical protein